MVNVWDSGWKGESRGLRSGPAGGSRTPLPARLKALARPGRLNVRCGNLEEAALNELVAQLVEQRPFKAWVVRSNRTELTTPAANPLPRISSETGRCAVGVFSVPKALQAQPENDAAPILFR